MLVVFVKKKKKQTQTVKADCKLAVKPNNKNHKAACCAYINDHLSLVTHAVCPLIIYTSIYFSRAHFL